MFRLQKLEITGFKSFADTTEVVFTGDGITAVVGPNGCGKSNIADAITWVLGEQSAKNLRGAEMRDVIFQGTKTRQPGGMAEVVLHLVKSESPNFFAADADELENAVHKFEEHSDELCFFDEAEIDDSPDNSNGSHSHSNGNGTNGSGSHRNGANGNGLHIETANGNGFSHSNAAQNSSHVSVTASSDVAVAEASNGKQQTAKKRVSRARRVGLDFAPGEAVSVARRLYRSGDSEYLLNGRACRLRDIQDLFAGTGLAGAGYALIEQGRIGQILTAKPTDRRQLIEEAAGIGRFRQRQRSAEARLEAAKTNLRRLSDIVTEIERQANALKRQAARTRRYTALREELRELSERIFAYEWQEFSAVKNELETKLLRAAAVEGKLVAEAEEHTVSVTRSTEAARQAEDQLAALRAAATTNAVRYTQLTGESARQSEQIKSFENRTAALKHEIAAAEKQIALAVVDVERLREKNVNSQNEDAGEQRDFKTAEGVYQNHLATVRQLEDEIEKTRAELLRHTAASERLAEIVRQQINVLERIGERAEGLSREGERAAQTCIERRRDHEKAVTELNAAHEAKKRLTQQRQITFAAAQAAGENLRRAEKVVSSVRDEANAIKHRSETLRKLDSSNAMFAPAVQKVFASTDEIGVKLLGTLADLMRVEPRFERAVEAVFGASLQTVLAADLKAAEKVAEWVRANKAGRLSILIVPETEPREPHQTNGVQFGGQKRIADLCGLDESLRKQVNLLFPQQMQTRVVEDLTEVAEFSNEVCVTGSGEMSWHNQFFVVGDERGQANSILSFKRELRELDARAKTLAEELRTAETQATTAREALATAETAAKAVQSQLTTAEQGVFTQETSIKSVRIEIERAERHRRVVADERARLDAEAVEVIVKRDKAKAEAEAAAAAKTTAANRLADISNKLRTAKRVAEHANAELSEQRAALAANGERRRSLVSALRRGENELTDLRGRHRRQTGELTETERRQTELQQSLENLQQEIAKAEVGREQEARRAEQAAAAVQTARETADRIVAELNLLNAELGRARDRRATFEIETAENNVRLQNLLENCLHETNKTPIELVEANGVNADFGLEKSKREAEALREKLDNFGAVNLLALTELDEAETRLLFLTSQRTDIVDSIAAAEAALGEIKRRSRERFERAFNQINRNFTKLFAELFGGGQGSMNLLDAEDVLESGIEIVAQPPGKRLQNLLLLSGGEKAMTAIALVLAIFQFRPSPFCLLDEVDAPLDEANVGRFIEKVGQMSEHTQFIVVTHNKRTMESARALYGVTMQEAGVSKVVSVRFE